METPENTASQIHTALVERGYRASRVVDPKTGRFCSTYRHLATDERIKVTLDGVHAHVTLVGYGASTTGNISPLCDLDIDTQIANWIKATR